MHLVSWRFGVGDIETLAGAGQATGTWLVAQRKDRALLDIMALDIDQIFKRRGLVDLVSLHRRWDRKLRLLKNNKPVTISHPGGHKLAVVDNMDRFTWILTIIVAALEAPLGAHSVEQTLSEFLGRAFEESPVGTEYLPRELAQHVQGWRSSACVRGILARATETWRQLENQKQHWPAIIPSTDERELVKLLLWLTMDDTLDSEFKTASSDVFCVSCVLEELGMELRTTDKEQVTTNNCLVVRLTDDLVTCRQKGPIEEKRWGMRIPLDFMEECVSL